MSPPNTRANSKITTNSSNRKSITNNSTASNTPKMGTPNTTKVPKTIADLYNLLVGLKEDMNNLKTSIEGKFEAIKTEIQEIKRDNESLVQASDFMSNRIDLLESNASENVKSMDTLSANFKEMSSTNANNIALVAKIEGELNRIEQKKLANNIVITGTSIAHEPTKAFWQLIKTTNANIKTDDVLEVVVLNKKPQQIAGKSKRFLTYTILVKFACTQAKTELISAKKKYGPVLSNQLSDSPQQNANLPSNRNRELFLRDHLTSFSMFLYDEVKKVQSSSNLQYVWTNNGRVLATAANKSKTHEIRSRNDIEKLQLMFPKLPESDASHPRRNNPSNRQSSS